MSSLKITFLSHSGFVVETAAKVLVFDYYHDDNSIVRNYDNGTKPLWFFVSHNHGDHFNQHIASFQSGTHYILNRDVPFVCNHPDRVTMMNVYDTCCIDDVEITHYGSTDEGGSFLVKIDGTTIFHAGDLNWWHWLGDTDENNRQARQFFDHEMAHLDGRIFDVAFFPVDARLEKAREWGVLEFLKHVSVTKLLVPMHYFGAPWSPSPAFDELYHDVPLWIPEQNGDTITIPL